MTELTGIKGVLIDLGGVVYSGDTPIPGAAEALARLNEAGLPYRFLTNTTSQPISGILAKLNKLGIEAERRDLFTPSLAARSYLETHDLAPHFLVAPALMEDFDGIGSGGSEAVVIGDARDGFTYDSLTDAFRRILDRAAFVALASNRSYVGSDGRPCLDVGAFVAALQYATRTDPVVLGKPSADFFHLAAADMELEPAEVVMIGDDYEFDALAAIEAGLSAIFVRSGKAPPEETDAGGASPTAICDDLAAAVEHILTGK